MAETPSGEQKTTDKAKEAMQLSEAVRIVKAAIKSEEDRLKRIANSEGEAPVMMEGMTAERFFVQLMIDPATVAKIMLDYWYPVYSVLGEDAPPDMWDAMSRMVGLDEVSSVDL